MSQANDCKFIEAPALEQLFRDKDTGLPLAAGTVEFFIDSARTIQKPVYKIAGTPGLYTYEALPNPVILNIAGYFDDVIYYNPYDDQGNVELYFIVVKNSAGIEQKTVEGYPSVCSDDDGDESLPDINYIENPQFRMNINVPEVGGSDPGEITQPVTYVGYGGWLFSIPDTFSSKNIILFDTFTETITNPEAHPPRVIRVECQNPIASEGFKDLRKEFIDVNFLAGEEVTLQFESLTSAVDVLCEIVIINNYGPGGSAQTETSVGSILIDSANFEKNAITFNMPDNSGKTIDSDVFKSSVFIAFRFPTSVLFNISMTNFLLTKGSFQSLAFPDYSLSDSISDTLGGGIQLPNVNGSDEGKFLAIGSVTRAASNGNYPQIILTNANGTVSSTIITSNITLTNRDFNKIYEVDCSSGNITITFPPYSDLSLGDHIKFFKKDTSDNFFKLKGNGTENISNFNEHDFYGRDSWVNVTAYSNRFKIDDYYDVFSTFFDVNFPNDTGQTITGSAAAQRVLYSTINNNVGGFWKGPGTYVAQPTIPGAWRYDFSGGYDTRSSSQGLGRSNVTLQKDGIGVSSGSQMNTRDNDSTANIFFYSGSVELSGSQGTIDVVTSVNQAGNKPFRSFSQDNANFVAGLRGILVKREI